MKAATLDPTSVLASALTMGLLLLNFTTPLGAQAVIYRCEAEGGVVYSDRACGAGADPHEIDDSRVTVYTPQPIVERAPVASPAQRAKAKRSKPKQVADQADHRARCSRLDQGLRDIRNKMRTGYGVKEGERLKVRRRQLVERRRAEKCG